MDEKLYGSSFWPKNDKKYSIVIYMEFASFVGGIKTYYFEKYFFANPFE